MRMASGTSTMFRGGECTLPAIAPAVRGGERGVRGRKERVGLKMSVCGGNVGCDCDKCVSERRGCVYVCARKVK
jgi:hypothetical protein